LSELKLISPLLDGLELVRTIQASGGTTVCLMRRASGGQEYILKLISVPESQTQVDALLLTGAAADEEAAKKYYEQVVDDYQQEFAILETVKGSPNVATYLGHQICPKDEGVGFEIYLLSEKWTTLVSYLSENAMTHLRALNLGLDLCSALCDLRTQGLIHRDVKPENIYLNGLNGFMLGDLGVACIDNLKYCAMPERMISEYTAPELSDILNPFNTTIDIYSVGMVLYRILNGNHGPFEDEKTSAKAANKLRLSGEPLPAPLYGDYELAAIILKACAFEPSDRYQTPEEFMQELVLYMKRNTVTDSLVVPPLVTDPDMIVSPEDQDEEIEPVSFTDVSQLDSDFVRNFSPDQPKRAEPEATPEPAAPPEPEPAALPAEPPAPTETPPEPPAEEEAPPEKTAEEPAEQVSLQEQTPAQPETREEPAPKPPTFAAPPVRLVPDEDETPGAAPSAEPVRKTGKKRHKIWIPVVIAVLLLGAIGLSVYYLVFGGPPLNISAISITDKGTDYVTVAVKAAQNDTDLTLLCTDTYGNVFRQPYAGKDVRFSNLTSGSQYTISVESNTRRKLTGMTHTLATTTATTEIVSFTATSPSVGQAELNLTVSGPDPGEWTVAYSAEGEAEKTDSFSGHTATISGLKPGLTYTFTLQQPEGTVLSGESSVQFSSAPSIVISGLKADSLTESSVKVSWSSDNDPGEWSVTCTGTDGSAKTQTTKSREAEFTELAAGETYTITVTSTGAEKPATLSISPAAASVSSVKADAENAGTVNVSWVSDSGTAAWQILYTPKGSALTKKQNADKNQATLYGLIPGTTYEIEIRSSTGEKLGGSAAAEVKTPAAEKFNAYGASRFFLGLFYQPTKAGWTYHDLKNGTKEFKTTDKMAFALQTLTGHTASDDAVSVTYVIKDAKDVPVECVSTQSTWNKLWNDEIYAGAVQAMPAKAGDYSLIIYFNNRLVTNKEFTVS